MSETQEKPTDFTATVPPPDNVDWWLNKDKKEKPEGKEDAKINVNESVIRSQNKIVRELSNTLSDIQLENMTKLAPLDSFDIEVDGKMKTFSRKKLTPTKIKQLKQAEREFTKDYPSIEDPDLKLDREHQLLAFKSKLYLDMTDAEFESCDVELLSIIIQATELRTQGFRRC